MSSENPCDNMPSPNPIALDELLEHIDAEPIHVMPSPNPIALNRLLDPELSQGYGPPSGVNPYHSWPVQSSQNSMQSPQNSQDSLHLLDDNMFEMAFVNQPRIKIIAQPKAIYRERYLADFDKELNRASRFIRSSEKNHNYPSIKIPTVYRDTQNLIRVALVTVPTSTAPDRYVHPYSLTVPESETGVIHDKKSNALYFPITEQDIEEKNDGIKRFCSLMLIKHKQDVLNSHGPMCLFDHDSLPTENQEHLSKNKTAKDLIRMFKLFQSQLAFTVLKPQNEQYVILKETTVYSQIMVEETENKKQNKNTTTYQIHRYAPKYGGCSGDDDVILILNTKIDKKNLSIHFENIIDNDQHWRVSITDFEIIDRTITFRSPPYFDNNIDESVAVYIVLTQNDVEIGRERYFYQPICTNFYQSFSNIGQPAKRTCLDRFIASDGIDDQVNPSQSPVPVTRDQQLTSDMQQLSLNTNTNVERELKDFLTRLKSCLAALLTDNDTQPLLRVTKKLINKYNDNLLHCAIKNGHTLLAQQLSAVVARLPDSIIERKNNNGETAIILAAKLNQIDLLETLFSISQDLIYAVDNKNNNVFHLLTSQNNSNKTIEFILNCLNDKSINIKQKFDQPNGNGKTPLQLSVEHSNFESTKMLIEIGHFNTNVTDEKNGDSLVHLAVRTGDLSMVKYFINDVKLDGQLSNLRMTPCDLAKTLNQETIYDFLNEKYPLQPLSSSDSEQNSEDETD